MLEICLIVALCDQLKLFYCWDDCRLHTNGAERIVQSVSQKLVSRVRACNGLKSLSRKAESSQSVVRVSEMQINCD